MCMYVCMYVCVCLRACVRTFMCLCVYLRVVRCAIFVRHSSYIPVIDWNNFKLNVKR